MKIDQIQVGFRYRRELGDVRALADSIAEAGLLHPIVVTPEGRLIAGQRRLEARRLLGWNYLSVTPWICFWPHEEKPTRTSCARICCPARWWCSSGPSSPLSAA